MTVASVAAQLAGLAAALADPAPAQAAESARPLVHVLLAYGFAWLALLGWGWRVLRLRKPKK